MLSEPSGPRDRSGFYKGFTSWTVNLQNQDAKEYGIYKVFVNCDLQPPHKQLLDFRDKSDLKCPLGKELIFKESDDSPACVQFKTAERLIERGWAYTTEAAQELFFEEKH